MKLIDWAKQQGISYLTAYRWFKAGDSRLADAYQSDSGTIIVPSLDNNMENSMESAVLPVNAMSSFIKKTVEFSKNNGSIEDFAAWVLTNFNLTENYNSDKKVSKSEIKKRKQTGEEIQNHYQSLIKDTVEKNKIKVAEATLNYSKVDIIDDDSGIEILDPEFKDKLSSVFNNEKESYENYKSGSLQKPPLSQELMESINTALNYKKEKSTVNINTLGCGSFVKSDKNILTEITQDANSILSPEPIVKVIKKKKVINSKNKKK